jgi:hypothetical protein
MVISWKTVKARRTSSSVKLRFSRLAATADEEELVALQFHVAVGGAGQQLHGGNEEAVGLGEQGDGGGSSKSMMDMGGSGDMRARQGRK